MSDKTREAITKRLERKAAAQAPRPRRRKPSEALEQDPQHDTIGAAAQPETAARPETGAQG